MARINAKVKPTPIFTHEGAKAVRIGAELELRRSVMACMLWENTFYETGVEISERISQLISEVDPVKVREIAIEARTKMKLRHVPLLIAREMCRYPSHKGLVAETLAEIIQRPDELTEFLAIYWKDKKQPLTAQVKKGLARAFTKFSAYSLAKYNRDDAIKLRDVLFLSHAKPLDEAQAAVWKKLVDGTLEVPDTWEVNLSAGKDKKETWERLIAEKKLGALALLRNLRNMQQAGVAENTIAVALAEANVERILPYRFIAAARYAQQLEPTLEITMYKCLADKKKFQGSTVIMIDVSGSMESKISGKSEMTNMEAACGLAILAREICEDVNIFTFSERLAHLPPRRGFALRDAIVQSQPHSGTYLGQAINTLQKSVPLKFDRLIVITDEQSADNVPAPNCEHAYVINVAAYKNGVGYGKWNHIDGWSEAVLDYIQASEDLNRNQ